MNDKSVEKTDDLKPYLSIGLNMADVPEIEERKKDSMSRKKRSTALTEAYENILENIEGKDFKRQGLLKTPSRAAEAMLYFTKGYEENLHGKCLHMTFEHMCIFKINNNCFCFL